MSTYYSKAEVEAIQNSYRHLFPAVSKELEQFWFPSDNRFDWLCLATPFHPGPTFERFHVLDNDLKRINRNQPPTVIGSELAAEARKHGLGYSVGLNPWADYLLLQVSKSHALQEVVIIVGNNWYPLVATDKRYGNKPPNSPLFKDSPCVFQHGKYAFAFDPFLNNDNPPLVFFTNIFPYFIEAGKPAEAGLTKVHRDFIEGNEGMKKGLVWTLEAINSAIQIRGLVTLGSVALAPFSTTKISYFMETFQKQLDLDSSNLDKVLPSFPIPIRGQKIPWLPYYHPVAHELGPPAARKKYEASYSKLAKTLLKLGREID